VSVYRNASTQENGEAMKKKRVLFTGGGGSGTTALWRLLGGKYELYFADADIRNIPPVIPSHRRVSVPLASASGFWETLRTICTDRGIDVLVPGVDEELQSLPEKRDGVAIMAPNNDFIRWCNKVTLSTYLTAHGLDAPKNDGMFPVILKPRHGRGSRGVHVANSDSQVAAWRHLYGQKPVMQEMVWSRRVMTVSSAPWFRCALKASAASQFAVSRNDSRT
jgi:carbamoyl-phosphate synthase large subunit